jgi:membrane-associated phospholipid phosphatase
MYDAWALVNGQQSLPLLSTHPGRPDLSSGEQATTEEVLSYAAYRVLRHRYRNSPGKHKTYRTANALMQRLGYDTTIVSIDYASGAPAAVGNFIASEIIAYGTTDGANEALDYANQDYPEAVNPPLLLDRPFSLLNLVDPSRWQPLTFPGAVVDQSGQILDGNTPAFLGASWGRVTPFALPDSVRNISTTAVPIYGNSPIYHDPGPPPMYDPSDTAEYNFYRWNFETVLKWSSHLDPDDGVMWDISPASRGNRTSPLPTTPNEYRAFYDQHEGGQPGQGYRLNPVTGQPYPPNLVPRGDYTRVLAEFWADGPASETPPGHWFAILNKVMDHPLFERKLWGEGPDLDPLEYDVKAYLTLGGTMHDAAITAWSIKGKYDYVRPITAIRWLSFLGQATDPTHRSYDVRGLRLDPGYIELVNSATEVVNSTALLNVKALSWVGNDAVLNSPTGYAGVDWINPSVWEPYQRPNFVTPNFAGYISGHSTFSSAAATVLEQLTGSLYFPGGIGEFVAEKNEFLVFEEGPSVDVVLQWATYRDASEETSLSRIWGGIHPPIDDIPGRRIGPRVAESATLLAKKIFSDELTIEPPTAPIALLFPNPAAVGQPVRIAIDDLRSTTLQLFDGLGRKMGSVQTTDGKAVLPTDRLAPGLYFLSSSDRSIVGKLQIR